MAVPIKPVPLYPQARQAKEPLEDLARLRLLRQVELSCFEGVPLEIHVPNPYLRDRRPVG
ncbi:MAG: hypothetical protein M3461_18805 [Pseudomonadota bacterium]|nr:hypothetical protein [Pseudomonadota bacterium]